MDPRGIWKVYPTGKFDNVLMTTECNEEMYELMGSYAGGSLYKAFPEEDIAAVDALLARSREVEKDTAVEGCIHIKNADGSVSPCMMQVTYGAKSEMYYIEIQKPSDALKYLEKVEEEKKHLRTFLTLAGGTYFTYNKTDDSFEMFWMDYEQRVTLFDMDFSQWEGMVLREGYVTGKDAAVFQTFCNSVRRADGLRTYVFRGSILSRGDSEEVYRVKFTRASGTDTVVEGMFMGIHLKTQDPVDGYVTEINLDPLTRILNKRAITAYAEDSIQKGENPAVIMVDIDGFKLINDTYGHPFGDQVLIAMADILKNVIGDDGVVGRGGGDEFIAILKNYGDEPGLRNYLRGIKFNFSALFLDTVGDNFLTCSMGISRCGLDAKNFSDLYRIADKALYIAKQKGKNRFIIYKPELHGRFNTSNDNLDMQEIRGSFYSEAGMAAFNDALSDVVLYGREKVPTLLEKAAEILSVDRILAFWGEERKSIGVYPPDFSVIEGQAGIFESEEYQRLFQNDMLTIVNMNRLEFSMKEAYDRYQANGIKSLMQHYLRDKDGNICGFVTAEECNTMRNFPKLATQIFKSMCKVLNAVLIRE